MTPNSDLSPPGPPAAHPPSWSQWDPNCELPPLTSDLAGWELQRERPSHRNARRRHAGRDYFLKWFFHGSLKHPARTEWRNALALEQLQIPSVQAVGWGLHRRGSFLVLAGSPGRQADTWWHEGPPIESLRRLVDEMVRYVARLHDAGLCHRDLNVYHILVDATDNPRLIDVGRVAALGKVRPRRWLVKDLASLLYSARREGFPESVARRFLQRYLKESLRPWQRRRLLTRVLKKSEAYRRHNLRKERRGEPL